MSSTQIVPADPLLRCAVNSQNFDELGYLAQVAQGIAGGFVVAAEDVYVEDVFPGASTHGTGLDLAQANVSQGEDAERLEERSGQVLNLEGDRSLVCAGWDELLVAGCGGIAFPFPHGVLHRVLRSGNPRFPRRLANQEEAGEVAFVVLDASLEDFTAVLTRGVQSSDASGVGKAMSDDVLHAACRVVERNWLDFGMMAEEVAALVERDWVRERLPQRAELHAGCGDHIVHDAEQKLALNKDISCYEKIGVLGDCAG